LLSKTPFFLNLGASGGPASASNAMRGRAHLVLESKVWRKDVALLNGHYEHPGALLRSALPQSPLFCARSNATAGTHKLPRVSCGSHSSSARARKAIVSSTDRVAAISKLALWQYCARAVFVEAPDLIIQPRFQVPRRAK
jgi:hypothetical protein